MLFEVVPIMTSKPLLAHRLPVLKNVVKPVVVHGKKPRFQRYFYNKKRGIIAYSPKFDYKKGQVLSRKS